MSGPGLRTINFGTLPTISYLAIVVEHEGLPAGATSVEHLYTEMHGLRDRGDFAALRVLLERVGLQWNDPLEATVAARRS